MTTCSLVANVGFHPASWILVDPAVPEGVPEEDFMQIRDMLAKGQRTPAADPQSVGLSPSWPRISCLRIAGKPICCDIPKSLAPTGGDGQVGLQARIRR